MAKKASCHLVTLKKAKARLHLGGRWTETTAPSRPLRHLPNAAWRSGRAVIKLQTFAALHYRKPTTAPIFAGGVVVGAVVGPVGYRRRPAAVAIWKHVMNCIHCIAPLAHTRTKLPGMRLLDISFYP